MSTAWKRLNAQIEACRRCPRLIAYIQRIAREKRRSFTTWDYWGKPVPNFGDPRARLLIVGLAPAAHGANRTGRMFTGDRSGDWLYRALAKAGFASQADAVSRDDGLQLIDCAITATCHCAPPDNKPDKTEIDACEMHLVKTIDLLQPTVYLALGQIAWKAALKKLRQRELLPANPQGKIVPPKFGHGAHFPLNENRHLLGSYHPSQQNTFTGRLTEPMFDAVFAQAKKLLTGKRVR